MEPLPHFVEPMLARAGALPPGDGWQLELKLDGCRGQLIVDRDRWTLRSRPGRDCTVCFPELASLARELRRRRVILDGELVSFAADGRPDFEALRPRLLGRPGGAAALAVFDVLHLDGRSTRELPYAERRRVLADLLADRGPSWLVPAPLAGAVEDVVDVVRLAELEGIVAKRLDASYRPGRRSPAWIKHKLRRQETLVVIGWSPAGRREPEAIYLARIDDTGRTLPAGRATFGLSREEREEIRDVAAHAAGRRGIHDIRSELFVTVAHHGRRGGPLRDPVMRALERSASPAPDGS